MEKILRLTDESGKETEYEILIAFKWMKTNKNYVVYTDNKYNNNELQIYINEYNPNNLEEVSISIKDKEEYKNIKFKVNSILLTMKNENEKLN